MKNRAGRNQAALKEVSSSTPAVKRHKTTNSTSEPENEGPLDENVKNSSPPPSDEPSSQASSSPSQMAATDYLEVVDIGDSDNSQMSDDDSNVTSDSINYHDISSDYDDEEDESDAYSAREDVLYFQMHNESLLQRLPAESLHFLGGADYEEDSDGFHFGYDFDDELDDDDYSSDGYVISEGLERFTQMFDFIHQLMMSRRNILGNYIPDDEFDDSYEALLRLSERIGEVKQRGFTQAQVDSLPTRLYQPDLSTSSQTQKEESTCPICLEAFTLKCKLMPFECGHQFHVDCSKQWLRQRATCPVCRVEIPPPIIDLREE